MSLARISGLLFGAISLVTGLVSIAISNGPLGLLAGLAGLAAGFVAYQSSAQLDHYSDQAASATQEVETLSRQLETATSTRTSDQAKLEQVTASFAEYMEANPPAGSFERKLNDTSSDFAEKDKSAEILADPETNLFSEAYFRVALDARIASARRHLRPVAVAILEVVQGEGKDRTLAADAGQVTGAIRQTLRDADTACRMSDGSFALILEDTPENGAVWTVERIRRNLSSRHGQHTTWAGIACYPAHAFSTDEILDQAAVALDAAREWQQDRIEIATAD